MKLGAFYPVGDLGVDPEATRLYAEAAEGLGYDEVIISEHVLGADRSGRPDWRPLKGGPPPYDHQVPFHDPFVAFGYLAGITERVTLMSAVLVLGQRQTALVAKQAAVADVLSGGRIRLGIGVGWNDVEYEAMGVDYRKRGAIVEEQISLLRRLWTEDTVSYEGRFHKISAAGINPLPVQRPIPIWIGGSATAVVDRAGRVADGLYPSFPPDKNGSELLSYMRQVARDNGRDPTAIGVMGALHLAQGTLEDMVAVAEAWKAAGATHLAFRTVAAGYARVHEHVELLERFKKMVKGIL